MQQILGEIIKQASNPFIWLGILAIGALVVKKKLNAYLKLLNLLIEAIEVIDTEIKDVVDDATRAKLTKIKEWIANRVGKQEALLNEALGNRGYLEKGVYKP